MISKTYQTPFGTIRYWASDNIRPDGISLIFLPGLTADHRLFDKQLEHFEDKYNVFVWDAPGHYMSRPFKLDFSLMDKAVWLHEILSAEGIEKPVLIGQSMGGYVSQCYMEKYPGEVRAFVSIDSAPIKRKYMTKAEIWLLKRTELIYRPYPWKALVKSGAKGCSETEYGQRLMREMMSGYSKDDYCDLVCHGYRILADAVEADLPYEISCPAMLICGEQDAAGSTKRYNKAWAREEGFPIMWIPNAGHNSNTDRPEAVNEAIDTFLAEAGIAI